MNSTQTNKGYLTARALYLINAVASMIMGGIYFFSPKFMPYHAAAISRDWVELTSGEQTLFLALLDVAGIGWLLYGVHILVILIFPNNPREKWIRFYIPLALLAFYIPVLFTTLRVINQTPGSPPWYGTLLPLSSAVIGLIADRPWKKDIV